MGPTAPRQWTRSTCSGTSAPGTGGKRQAVLLRGPRERDRELPNPDGSVQVENRGEYFFDGGPEPHSRQRGRPRRHLRQAERQLRRTCEAPGPGNYWICVDLDPDYRWAVVSDPTGSSAFLLSRTPTIDDDLYDELVDRAAAAGVRTAGITRTEQF
ncbi:MAG: lipocalin family protein [Microthrixaceae bacterium]